MIEITKYITEKFKIKKGISVVPDSNFYTVTLPVNVANKILNGVEDDFIIGEYDTPKNRYRVYLFTIEELKEVVSKHKDIEFYKAVTLPERLLNRIEDMKTGNFEINDTDDYMGTKEERKSEYIYILMENYK